MESSIRYILLIIGAIIIVGILFDGLRRKKRQERESPIGTIDLKRVKEKMPERKLFVQPHDLAEPEDDIVGEVRINGVPVSQQVVAKPLAHVVEPYVPPMVQEAEVIVEEEVPAPVVRVAPKPVEPLVQDGFVMLHVKASYDEGFGGFPLLQSLLAHKLQFGAHQFFHRHENNNPKGKTLFSVSSDVPPGTFNPTAMRDFQCQGLMLFMNVHQQAKASKIFEDMLETAQSLAQALDGYVLINQDIPCDEAHLMQLRSEL